MIKKVFLFWNPWMKIMFSHSFIFKCKLPKTQYSSHLSHHVWEVGSRLKSQTFLKFFVQRRTNFFKPFSELYFFNFFIFDVKLFNNKISETKPSHLTNDLHRKLFAFTRPPTSFFDEKFVFDSDSKSLTNFFTLFYS